MRHHIGAVVVLVGGILFAVNERAAAQGSNGPPPNYQQLVGEIAALQTQVTILQGQVAKLQGNITPADLVGIYTLTIIDTPLSGFVAGVPPRNATIETDAAAVSITLNADGSVSFGSGGCVGSRLTQGTWILTALNCIEGIPSTATWSYSSGVLTLTLGRDVFLLNVGLGGRLAINFIGGSHVGDQSSDAGFMILTRLQ